MARRCPNSSYVGRAVLLDHRWQINERGFANVIACSGFNVHGLVYQLGAKDEARLDRNEGVHSGAYSKARKSVVLYPAVPELQLPTKSLVEGKRGPQRSVDRVRQGSGFGTIERRARVKAKVLVYLSEDFTHPGDPREEYIDRINSGIRDAIILGVPAEFFENAVRSSIPSRPVVRRARHRARHRETTSATHQTVDVDDSRKPHSSSRQRRSRRAREDQPPPSQGRWANTVQRYIPSLLLARSLPHRGLWRYS